MATKQVSAFADDGMKATVDALLGDIAALYREDHIPWVIGYSGGKDSTAVLQLVWLALSKMTPDQHHKPVHVISTDTLVENPVVATWVGRSLNAMTTAAAKQGLPIQAHRLTPLPVDSFWVNLLGKGYPAPRPKFRWCTERLKIKPSTRFIMDVVKANGEAILLLGTRKQESQARGRNMEKHERRRMRDKLSPNASLPNSLIYSPIETWANDDVWQFLMQVKNPWGHANKDLLTMYQGANPDGECPLVVDDSTPSCGDSRFGCWVCTLVDKDKSMTAMIQNDEEKEWMRPLLDFRNLLDFRDAKGQMSEAAREKEKARRDFRRLNGSLTLSNHDELVHGPYKQFIREEWLGKLLQAQQFIRDSGNKTVAKIELITLPELREIRRIWLTEKHEIEDNLPRIYRDATGEPYPDEAFDDSRSFGSDELALLKELCAGDDLRYQMLRELLHVEEEYKTMARRAGLYERLTQAIERSFYSGADDAHERALELKAIRDVGSDRVAEAATQQVLKLSAGGEGETT